MADTVHIKAKENFEVNLRYNTSTIDNYCRTQLVNLSIKATYFASPEVDQNNMRFDL